MTSVTVLSSDSWTTLGLQKGHNAPPVAFRYWFSVTSDPQIRACAMARKFASE